MKVLPVPNLRKLFSRGLRKVLPALDRNLLLSRPDPAEFEPLEAGGLIASCLTAWPDAAADADFLDAWEQLSRAVPTAMAFHGPVWQNALWALRPGGGSRLRLLTVHRTTAGGDELLAVLPLALHDDGGLATPGAPVTDYLDPLIQPDPEPDVWRLLLTYLRQLWDKRLTGLSLHNVREASPCRTMLSTLAEEVGFHYGERVVEHAPALKLNSSWDAYLATLDAHERKETRRKLNKAETKGNARLVICGGGDDPKDNNPGGEQADIAATLHTALSLMEACGGEKGQAIRCHVRPLLEAAAPELIRQGRLWLATLLVNDEPAAVLVQFPSQAGPMLYNCGFDAAQKEWSPGVVAVSMAIRDAIETQHANVFDLLRGREAYKYKLGAVDRPLYRIDLAKRD